MRPKISIIIITRNRKDELKICIESILDQVFSDFELIIIDNNSSDGTKDMVKNIYREVKVPLIYKKLNRNLGVPGARNIGFKLSNSMFAYFIDDDAYIKDKNFLENLFSFIEKHSDIGIVQTKIFNIVTNNYQLCNFRFKSHNNNYYYEEVLYFIGCSHIIRCSLFNNEENLYPSNLFYGHEELFMSLRVKDKGFKIVYYPEVKVYHKPSKFSRMGEKQTLINNLVNKTLIKIKLYPKVILSLVIINFVFRLFKYIKINPKDWIFAFDLFSKRYSHDFNERIKFSTFKSLLKMYGLKII